MKITSAILLSILMLSTLCSCSSDDSDDIIWDIYPAGITIRLVDSDGRNLLDPNVEGNWVGSPMHIEYEGQSYSAIWERESIPRETRAYMPYFYGLIWDGVFYPDESHYCLYFGEFAGDKSYNMKTTFAIEELNTVFEIEYIRKFEWKKNKPHSTNYIYLNGQKSEGSSVEIVLPRRPTL